MERAVKNIFKRALLPLAQLLYSAQRVPTAELEAKPQAHVVVNVAQDIIALQALHPLHRISVQLVPILLLERAPVVLAELAPILLPALLPVVIADPVPILLLGRAPVVIAIMAPILLVPQIHPVLLRHLGTTLRGLGRRGRRGCRNVRKELLLVAVPLTAVPVFLELILVC